MVICAVFGCSNRSGRDKVSFYRIPKARETGCQRVQELSKARRLGFLAAISRSDLNSDKKIDQARICSRHFINGKPAELLDELNPDWLPTQSLGHRKTDPQGTANREGRYARKRSRQTRTVDTSLEQQEEDRDMEIDPVNDPSVSTQTEMSGIDVEQVKGDHSRLVQENRALKLQIQSLQPFTKDMLRNDDEAVRFFTGLPKFSVLLAVFEFVLPEKLSQRSMTLSPFQQFMAVLLKLRMNLPLKDLAYRFKVSVSTISRVWHKWIGLLDCRLSSLIMWPDRDNLVRTMPTCFQSAFGNKVAVIIDCFEVFIERPSNLLARACTWSSYKHHNTVKFLIGIAPQGVISYISTAWGGRVSDKHLTGNCGILKKLLPGDMVLADRGFNISESVGMHQAQLCLPAFTKGKDQLSATEVEETRTIANVRIHVERVIGLVRQKYTILQGTLPIDYLMKRNGEESPVVDRIARVCCALCNVCDIIVPFE